MKGQAVVSKLVYMLLNFGEEQITSRDQLSSMVTNFAPERFDYDSIWMYYLAQQRRLKSLKM